LPPRASTGDGNGHRLALVRYRFPGRRCFDAIVDIPFALPTAVAGVALTSLFAQKGWLGAPLAELGIKVGVHAGRYFRRDDPSSHSLCGADGAAGADRPRRRNRGSRASLGANRWHTFPR